MFEIELKFQIPEEKQEMLIKAFQRKDTNIQHLQAKYYDTAQFILSEHSISLRQRLKMIKKISNGYKPSNFQQNKDSNVQNLRKTSEAQK